ncbi:MAG TPA: hypothetical protein VJB90_05740 [Candidatus Nanoarchaeia archaeon]|nr:hypothetical protein [Candidatus Nanoarchaeia archaeon]
MEAYNIHTKEPLEIKLSITGTHGNRVPIEEIIRAAPARLGIRGRQKEVELEAYQDFNVRNGFALAVRPKSIRDHIVCISPLESDEYVFNATGMGYVSLERLDKPNSPHMVWEIALYFDVPLEKQGVGSGMATASGSIRTF